jgi:DNA-binding response OmpR family regulator
VAQWDFLEKPFTPKVLLERIAALLAGEPRASAATAL